MLGELDIQKQVVDFVNVKGAYHQALTELAEFLKDGDNLRAEMPEELVREIVDDGALRKSLGKNPPK